MSEAIFERILDVSALLRLPAHDVANFFETGYIESMEHYRSLSGEQEEALLEKRVPINAQCAGECSVMIDADAIIYSVCVNRKMALVALDELFDKAYRKRGNSKRNLLTRIRDVLNRDGPESVRPLFETYAQWRAPGFSFFGGCT